MLLFIDKIKSSAIYYQGEIAQAHAEYLYLQIYILEPLYLSVDRSANILILTS